MNHPQKIQHLALIPRQQTLDFEQADRWRGLPETDQRACLQALALLLKEVVSQISENNDHEREDSNATS